MADDKDKKDEKKDEKKEKAAEAGAVKKASPIGPILAIAVLVGGGAGGAWYGYKTLLGPQPAKDGKAAVAGHGGGEAEAEHKESILHTAKELVLEDIMTNITDQGGRRFVKMSVALWIDPLAAANFGGGGGHGGGGGGGDDIKRILVSKVMEHLKTYSLDELQGRNIQKQLEKGVGEVAEKELHVLFPALEESKRLVKRVVITQLLTQ